MAFLHAMSGYPPGTAFEIADDRTEMGRSPDCTLVLDSAAVSRRHAVILKEGGRFFVEDLGSRNGTFLNGHRVETKSPIFDRDKLTLCDLSFEFRLSDADVLAQRKAATMFESSFLLAPEEAPSQRPHVMSKLEVNSEYESQLLPARPEAKLAAIIEISRSLSQSISIQDILPRLLDSLFKLFLQADRAFVVLANTESNRLVPAAMRHRREKDEEVVRISQTIITEAMEKREAILSADATSDTRFEMAESIADFRIRSMMCAPMVNAEGVSLGVIQVDTLNQKSRFNEDDLGVLATVASQTAFVIDNARLQEASWKQRSLARDLELAHRVQRGLLPSKPPEIPGYHFFHFYDAAYQVGGDYYDYVPLSGGRVAIVVGDVAGKGVSAAMLMAKLSGEVRFHLASHQDLGQAFGKINQMFVRNDWEDRFVTMVVAVLNPIENTLSLVNAGHMPPLLRHSGGTVEEIGEVESGLPLGVMEDYEYQTYKRTLEPGDFLTIFTDGISEAMNSQKEIYGIERLSRQVGTPAVNVVELGNHILENVREFVGGQQQSDDMCLTCFGRDEAN